VTPRHHRVAATPPSHFFRRRKRRRANRRRGRRQHLSATGRRSHPQASFGVRFEPRYLGCYFFYGLLSRKNKFPACGLMVTLLVVPLVVINNPVFIQFAVFKSEFCCKTKSVAEDGHETVTVEG